VPSQYQPVIAAGSFSRYEQPTIPVGTTAVLRPWALIDAAALAAAYQDPEILRWHSRRADSVDEVTEWIERWRNEWTTESGCNWAVADVHTGSALGRISLTGLDLEEGMANLAYWMVRGARGHGLGTMSVIAASNWAFAEAGFHRIQLEHSTRNARSCRVADKAGFRGEGVRRSAGLHADGWHDMHVHARLSTDRLGE